MKDFTVHINANISDPHPLSDKYKNHKIFKDMGLIMEFYEFVSCSSYGCLLPGNGDLIQNPDSYIFSSIGGTIESMFVLLQTSHINDAFALLRVYFDEILIATFFSAYRTDQFNEKAQEHCQNNMNLYYVKKVKTWIEGISDTPKCMDAIKYFKRSNCYQELFNKFDFEGKYKKIREILDDSVHINGFSLMVKNDNSLNIEYREDELDNFHSMLSSLFQFHLASIIHLDSNYVMSSDCRDYRDIGQIPPEGSEYWVCPKAQEVFVEFILPDKNLADFFKETCDMEFDYNANSEE